MTFGRISVHMACFWRLWAFLTSELILANVALHLLDFKHYKWLLPGLMIQNLGQVVGLAIYAVSTCSVTFPREKPGSQNPPGLIRPESLSTLLRKYQNLMSHIGTSSRST